MSKFDYERVYAIAADLRLVLERHDSLLAGTIAPQFRELLELSRKWWIEWLAAGLHDIVRDREQDALELTFCDRLAVLESAMLELAGVAGCKRFLAWAQVRRSDYMPPMMDGQVPESWANIAAPRPPVLRMISGTGEGVR